MPGSRPQVLYIGGNGRSGSTLLARMLGRYQGFVSVGELRYVWDRGLRQNYLCACGQPFRSCPFWIEVLDEAFGGAHAVNVAAVENQSRAVDRERFVPLLASRRFRPAPFERALGTFGEVLDRLYRAILSVAGGDVVVDSSKDPSYAFVLGALESVDLSVVHLVRDSRAVAHSWTRTRVRPEIHWTVEHMRRLTPLRSAWRWDTNNALFELLGRRTGRFTRLRYEDFVRAPEDHLAKVAALGDGRDGQGPRAVGPDDRFPHSMSGNPMRFDKRPVRIVPDEEWRTGMERRDRRLVTALTAPLLLRYGYLGSRLPAVEPLPARPRA